MSARSKKGSGARGQAPAASAPHSSPAPSAGPRSGPFSGSGSKTPPPAHIAVIMDGNGRWAKARGLKRTEGHRAGAEAVRRTVTACRERGVTHLTLYAFSTENWRRPKEEVGLLFSLLVDFLTSELPLMLKNSIRLNFIGEMDGLPGPAVRMLKSVLRKTAGCEAMTLTLALNYSGRSELVRAVRKLVAKGTAAKDVSEETLAKALDTADLPDPDLIIRTSGEQRLSNFLLYQAAYSELYFTDLAWPDFDERALDEALADYAGRQRRFGRTGEQLEHTTEQDG